MKYSIVVPVFNGTTVIRELASRVAAVFATMKDSYELIFIHDGGHLATWQTAQELARLYPNEIVAVKLSRNYGQHNALIAGISYSTGDWIITLDEDLQQDPADIPLLVQEQERTGCDLVYGYFPEQKHSAFRRITSSLLRKTLRRSLPGLHPDYSPFRLIRGDVARLMVGMNNSPTFLDGYLTWITQNASSVKVGHFQRQEGESTYNLSRLIQHTTTILVTFSSLPIRLVSYTSFTLFFVSLVYAAYIALRRIIYHDLVPGYASIIFVLGLGIGLILFALGVIGEYIYRINQKTTRRPNSITRTAILNGEELPEVEFARTERIAETLRSIR